MRIVSTIGASAFNHDDVDYTADADGTFEVPEEVGNTLVGFDIWQREYEAVDAALAEQAVHNSDPSVQAARISELEGLLEDAGKRIAALEKSGTPAPAKKAAPAKAPASKR
jgi:hypothetical protein